jgi:hypothetical protein
MGVGFIQLITVGNENIIFNKDPQITFFKIYYRRHTNFFINSMEINGNSLNYLKNNTENNTNNSLSWLIPKNGDLLGKSYIKLKFREYNFELFSLYQTLYSTLNTNVLDFYNDYYIIKKNYNFSEKKIIRIFKIKYYLNQDLILELMTTNIINQEILQQLIMIEKDIELETDDYDIFYNINETFDFYAYKTVNKVIKTDNIFNKK